MEFIFAFILNDFKCLNKILSQNGMMTWTNLLGMNSIYILKHTKLNLTLRHACMAHSFGKCDKTRFCHQKTTNVESMILPI